jgi:thiamine-monophosphate kinase
MPVSLLENQLLRQIGNPFPRSPEQRNQLLESDAELIRMADGSTLALTTDCIAEEIQTGLYSDPEHIGWMTVAVNMSDLAAVGARPLGLLLSESLPPGFPSEKLIALQNGIAAACKAMGVYVLGGDTNTSSCWQMGGTAIGIIPPGEQIISRKGAQAGHLLYASGAMGQGSAYAFSVLFGTTGPAVHYRPTPRLDAGALVRRFGSSCIDTSDGFFHALANLTETNHLGFYLQTPLNDYTHPDAQRISQAGQLPLWIFLAGPHGEFELLFTLPPENESDFLKAAAGINWMPLKIGVCTADGQCSLTQSDGTSRNVSPAAIANAFPEALGDPKVFLQKLLTIDASWQSQI